MVTGFLFGAAIDVVIGELPKLTGTDVTGANPMQELRSWCSSLGGVRLGDCTCSGHGVRSPLYSDYSNRAAHSGGPRSGCRGLLVSWIFDLGAHGVALVGEVPRGLPTVKLPEWHLVSAHTSTIAVAAVALVLIGFSQTTENPDRSLPNTTTELTSTKNLSLKACPTWVPVSSRECPSPPVSRQVP